MAKEKEMNPSSQMVFDMAKIFLDIQTSSFESGMKHAKEDAEREQKMQDFADKCERDLEEEAFKMEAELDLWESLEDLVYENCSEGTLNFDEYEQKYGVNLREHLSIEGIAKCIFLLNKTIWKEKTNEKNN